MAYVRYGTRLCVNAVQEFITHLNKYIDENRYHGDNNGIISLNNFDLVKFQNNYIKELESND